MRRNSLFNRFIIQSLLSFVIIGALLTYFVANLVITQEINHNIEIVTLTLGHSLDHWFEDVELNNLSNTDIEDLDIEFMSLNELGDIADIRIWQLDGELIYSQNHSLIGKFHLEIEDLYSAKSILSNYELTTADAEDNNMFNKYGDELIKIYLPINDHDHVIGIFEVYRSFDHSRDSINSSIISILLILFIGLFILYFFLARTIYSSSNKLIQQTDEISTSYDKLNQLFKSMIKAITRAIDARDKFTSGHSQRVADYTIGFAKHLNFDSEYIGRLEIAALLHDIGKLGVPEEIINKPGKLSDEEFNLIKQHPVIGELIIDGIDELEDIIGVVKYHHERYSGYGYPDNLKGDNIPLMARIITITDAYDAMTSNRPYREGLSHKAAINEIKKYAGNQFDPDLALSFIDYITNQHKTN